MVFFRLMKMLNDNYLVIPLSFMEYYTCDNIDTIKKTIRKKYNNRKQQKGNMNKKIEQLSDRIAKELCWQEVDWINEINEHKLLYYKTYYNLVNQYGFDKFQTLILSKIEKIRRSYKKILCDNLDNYKNLMIVYFKTKKKGKKQNGKK